MRFTLQEEPKATENSLLFPNIQCQWSPPRAHPPILESDFLVQTFIENVDPFVRIVHKPTLLLGLNHFRRGVVANPTEFETSLFAIYSLALLPLSPTLVEYRLHESKKDLISRYRANAEHGLSRMNLTTTQSLATLQTFLLYIVSRERLIPVESNS